jgi:DUF3037 family protein
MYSGYYSLIQWCPNRARAEVVNVGVLVLCPHLGVLDVKLTTDYRRVEHIFGPVDTTRLHVTLRGFEHKLRTLSIQSVRELERFALCQGNDLQVTASRALSMLHPSSELELLFEELVNA